jgi:hypothetical protein
MQRGKEARGGRAEVIEDGSSPLPYLLLLLPLLAPLPIVAGLLPTAQESQLDSRRQAASR